MAKYSNKNQQKESKGESKMIGVIIQARTQSSRFKRKIYEDLSGKTTLYRVLESATRNSLPHKIILAMPDYDEQEFIMRQTRGDFDGAIDDRFCTYFGNPDDLVDRYHGAANKYGIDLIVRLTADCPFGGIMVDEMLCEYLKKGYNGFVGNNHLVAGVPYPDGTDIEIFPYWMLVETMQLTKDSVHREHVSPFMYRRGTEYSIYSFLNRKPNSTITMKFNDFSFDTIEDKYLLLAITENYDKIKMYDSSLSEVEALNKALESTIFKKLESKKE